MPTVLELSAPYENFLFGPEPGLSVCARCFNLTDGYRYCYACTHLEASLDAFLPISYSVAHEQLHHALASYKRYDGSAARRLTVQLAAVLWRFLDAHETCVAEAAGVDAFTIVTAVPSGDRDRDQVHPLRWIVGEVVGVTRDRYRRLLRPSLCEVAPRAFAPERFIVESRLSGESVLLIDDTWTTGAKAQSASAALKAAGAGPVAAVVIGRHVNRDWHDNDPRLRALPPFDWSRCGLCRQPGMSSQRLAEKATPA